MLLQQQLNRGRLTKLVADLAGHSRHDHAAPIPCVGIHLAHLDAHLWVDPDRIQSLAPRFAHHQLVLVPDVGDRADVRLVAVDYAEMRHFGRVEDAVALLIAESSMTSIDL